MFIKIWLLVKKLFNESETKSYVMWLNYFSGSWYFETEKDRSSEDGKCGPVERGMIETFYYV